METERLANFQVEWACCPRATTAHGPEPSVNPSEYAIGVFLAEEVVPQSRRGAATSARPPRVPSRRCLSQGASLAGGRRRRVDRCTSGLLRVPSPWICRVWALVQLPYTTTALADVLSSLSWRWGNTAQRGTTYINMVNATRDLPRVEAAIASFIHIPSRICVASRCHVERSQSGEVVALNTSGLKFKMTSTVYDSPGPAPRAPLYPLLDKIQRKRMICQNLNSTYVRFPEIFANVLAETGGSGARFSNNGGLALGASSQSSGRV